jgi:hypothetical protein
MTSAVMRKVRGKHFPGTRHHMIEMECDLGSRHDEAGMNKLVAVGGGGVVGIDLSGVRWVQHICKTTASLHKVKHSQE